MKYFVVTFCLLTLVGCNNELAQLNQSLKRINQTASGKVASPPAGQEQQINIVLDQSVQDENLKTAVEEAKSSISGFLSTNACIKGYDGSLLNKYAAPGKVFPNRNYSKAPIPRTKYHDKTTCMSVRDISELRMPANNALSFDVVYISDSSGESFKFHHEMIKQSNSQWLFTK